MTKSSLHSHLLVPTNRKLEAQYWDHYGVLCKTLMQMVNSDLTVSKSQAGRCVVLLELKAMSLRYSQVTLDDDRKITAELPEIAAWLNTCKAE